MSSGGGYSQLDDIFSAMDIPVMTEKTYKKYHDKVCEGWQTSAAKEMEAAAKTEASNAIMNGDVDTDGVPLITVIADGSWCKRSYRSNYSSLAGVGAIVGYHTKKVLFIAVKNKYCTTCARADSKGKEAPEHNCFKNWSSHQSSSSMEAAAIVEGFCKSEEMYGVRYARLIADGDSSVYKKVLDAGPYKLLSVEKIECRNHLLRNYCNKIRELVTTCSKGICDRVERKLIAENVLRFRTAVTKAVEFRKSQDIPLPKKTQLLERDILNSPSHIFGEHEKCKIGYFCDGKVKSDQKNYIPELKRSGVYEKLMCIVKNISRHSRSLIYDVDNNPVEHYNAVIAKLIGGKRVNYALSRSYKGRCDGAVVSFNSGNPLRSLYKNVCDVSPGYHCKKSLQRKSDKALSTSFRRKGVPRSKRSIFNRLGKNRDPDYGPFSERPDMPNPQFEDECRLFLKSLQKTKKEIEDIERQTVGQGKNNQWVTMRRKKLTASNFGRYPNNYQETTNLSSSDNSPYGKATRNCKLPRTK
ncbi:uncharacterized protein LOC124163807 [Ischnura elegans]|uniref:uncharacterized protein LOC124163807 n=1 Tax=Ischnura elegans TaxID=197161 RepID=UPI001ED8BFCB|nr:uncharacterized protein LOC124163807 [Ischnura elegans]